LPQGRFVPSIPPPLTHLYGFDQASFSQNRHMMGDGGLRKMYAQLYIGCAKTDVFADGARPAFFQGLQYAPASGIGDGVQRPLECFFALGHGYIIVVSG